MVWRNLPPYHRFYYSVLSFQTKRAWQSGSKHLQRWYRGRLRQTIVNSWYCLDLFVPEGMSQVLRRSEVGNHKRRSLNTRLSSGTSVGTFACPAGPYRKCWGEAGRKNEPNRYFVPVQKKGSESRSSRFEPKIFLISFSRGSGPPLRSWRVSWFFARLVSIQSRTNQFLHSVSVAVTICGTRFEVSRQ